MKGRSINKICLFASGAVLSFIRFHRVDHIAHFVKSTISDSFESKKGEKLLKFYSLKVIIFWKGLQIYEGCYLTRNLAQYITQHAMNAFLHTSINWIKIHCGC